MARKAKTPHWLEAARHRGGTPASEKPDWLLRALLRAGAGPQADLERQLRDGKVKVDGRVAREPYTPLTATSRVQVAGREVDVRPRTRVLAFHKRAGTVTAQRDPEGQGTVFEALACVLPHELLGFAWHAVGRLDRDTTGLLLFTTDERFVAHATAPATHLPKRYLATVGADPTPERLAPLLAGIALADGPARPAVAKVRGPRVVELTLTEGRNHQVKRMLGAVGLPVLALHREAIGALALDVEPGQARALTDAEVEGLLGFLPRR